MSILVEVNLYKLGSGAPSVVVPPNKIAMFDASEPGSNTPTSVRAVEIDGRWYPIAADCPVNGYATWVNEISPEEAAKERIAMSLTTEDRAVAFPGFKTRAERQVEHAAAMAVAEDKATARSQNR